MCRPPPWWQPDVFAPRLPALRARARIKAAVRAWFAARSFDEVETPVLQLSPGNETHVAGFATSLRADDGSASTLYLHSSPEFACKKLLAAGVPRLFTQAPVFRNGTVPAPRSTISSPIARRCCASRRRRPARRSCAIADARPIR